ncbi:helix-turn-helix domain-containing protein [Streptomyces sp. HNM0575]|uniref:helix-turn-helix domain-containing protein n=1 Tax=Streptomyces sp. HNM0575 TaxID=2716338 RepID=UPI00145C49E1|nr:XRE family transcriptional regulator [Streptomyces sp. HNM0575]NLU72648.1 helix-turn-helix domain-containing protein [Streptomyces sp. HNM0575]
MSPTPLEAALEKVIAQRVREFRSGLGWSVAHLAELSGLSKSMLSKIENAKSSASLNTLARLSSALNVPVTAFFRGLDEEHDVIHIKAGRGLDIEHRGSRQGSRYQLLGRMRHPYDILEPVQVTVTRPTEVFPLFQHGGTELILMQGGIMGYSVGDDTYVLEPGDSLQFAGDVPHGPVELRELPVEFVTVKAIPTSG